MTDLPAAYAHCEALLRADDPDAWLAALLAPAAARPHLHALGAFALEVGLVRSRVTQAIAGEIRLQWWQDVADGERASEAAAHPVAAALVDTISRAALPRESFGDMLDAYRVDLYDEPPADLPALERRLGGTHVTPIRLAARVLGVGAAIDPRPKTPAWRSASPTSSTTSGASAARSCPWNPWPVTAPRRTTSRQVATRRARGPRSANCAPRPAPASPRCG